MNGQQSSDNGSPRLDRIERLLEALVDDHEKLVDQHPKFADEHRMLLRAQVVLTERVDKLAQAQPHTDERLNALSSVVDDIVRRPPPHRP